MTKDATTRVDRILRGLFVELADAHTPDYLEGAIERASSRRQRPAWAHPGSWLPMQITTEALPAARGQLRLIGILAILAILTALATVAYVGSRPPRTVAPSPFSQYRNGVIAVAKDGDILVAERPGGDLRPLVAGPEVDSGPVFSPDGTKLAFVRETERGSVQMLADADGTNIVQIPPDPPGLYGRFAPDGQSLVGSVEIDGEWRFVIRPIDPTAVPTVLPILLDGSSMLRSEAGVPSFNPTNPQEILVVGKLAPEGPRGIYVFDVATSGIRTVLEQARDQYVFDVAWFPDGGHITYRSTTSGGGTRVVAVDGSGDRLLNASPADRLSPPSNDGTRIVIDVAAVDLPGDDSHQRSVVVPVNGEGHRVELACGLGTKIECAWSWTWSPDDAILIGTVPHWTSADNETSLPDTYLQADPNTGQVTELDWVDVGEPVWQRVAP